MAVFLVAAYDSQQRIGVLMGESGWVVVVIAVWIALSIPIGVIAGGLIKHGHDGEA